MAINDIKGLPPAPAQNAGDGARVKAPRNEPSGAAPREDKKPAATDTVSLTDAAQRLRELEKSVASLPVVDTQRVDAVKKALADGTYRIKPERIADKMLGFENALTGKLYHK